MTAAEARAAWDAWDLYARNIAKVCTTAMFRLLDGDADGALDVLTRDVHWSDDRSGLPEPPDVGR